MLLRDLRAADLQAAAAGASISSQALWPGGLVKVEPPVRLRGWLASARAVSISAMRARDRRWSPGAALQPRRVKIQSAGASLWR